MKREPTAQEESNIGGWICVFEGLLSVDYLGHPDTKDDEVRVMFTLDHGRATNIRITKHVSYEADKYAEQVIAKTIGSMNDSTEQALIKNYPRPFDVEFRLKNHNVAYVSPQREQLPPDWRRIFLQTLNCWVGASFVNPNEKMQPVTVTFVVDEHGSLSELKVTKHSTALVDDESAINAVKKGFEKTLLKLGPNMHFACISKIEGCVEFARNKIILSELTTHGYEPLP